MKEIIATAKNITLAVIDDELHCIVEAVVTVSEPAYELDSGGELVRVMIPEVLRFATSPRGMRQLARTIMEWADEADKTCEMITNGDVLSQVEIKMP